MSKLMTATIAFVLTATATAPVAGAAEIKVLCSGALKLAMIQLVPDFQKSSSNAVTIEYDVGARIANRIQKANPRMWRSC
jgi:ABC-type molybdate transport system substrate-binding protein